MKRDMQIRETTESFLDAMKGTYFSGKPESPAEYLRGECRLLSLVSIDREKSYTAGEIARILEVSTARVAAMLGNLENKRYIKRKQSENDKRIVYVNITEEGRGYLEKKREELCAFFDRVFIRLEGDERAEFIRLVRKLTGNG